MDARLLGPTEVLVAGARVELTGRRELALLALLALRVDEALPVDEVIAALWGRRLPDSPERALALLVDRVAGQVPGVRLGPAGCRLEGRPEQVDALEFRRLAGVAAHDQGESALETLESALALWRGPALADLRDVPFAATAGAELDEERLDALERRHRLMLDLGRSGVAEDVRRLLDDHPDREHSWAHLVDARLRDGDAAGALAAYDEARAALADELGTEPGQVLQELADRARGVPTPALASAPAATRSRLPRPRTATIGRERLVEEVVAALGEGERLVTLTGLGGCGKTRVAVVVAGELHQSGAEVHFVVVPDVAQDVAVLRDVAEALGLERTEDPLTAIAELPEERQPVLVLDNAEALPGGAEVVRRLLDAAPRLTVLATSRMGLGLSVERAFTVPPLAVPDAVALFTEVARRVAPEVDLSGEAAALERLCRLLDGVPLALELAAARLRVLDLAHIHRSLEQSLELLTTSADDVPERQRALATTIAWSFERLDPASREVGARLAVFERTFGVDAVEAVCPGRPGVVDALTAILEAGLVRSQERAGEFVVPTTVRAFLREQLRRSGDLASARQALADHLLTSLRERADGLHGPHGSAVLATFEAEDVASAIGWALEAGRIPTAVGLTLAARPFWIGSGRLREGLELTRRVQGYVAADSAEAARLHEVAGRIANNLSEADLAARELRAAIRIGEQHDDATTVASARCFLAATLLVTGGVEEGTVLAEQSSVAADALDLYPLGAEVLAVLALAKAVTGDFDAERELHLRRLALVRRHDDAARTADALNILAEIALDESDGATAQAYASESLAISEAHLPVEARDALITLARAAAASGDATLTASLLRRAVTASDRIGQSLALAQCLRVAGGLAATHERPGLAVRLFAAAQALSPSPSGTDDPVELDLAASLAEARRELGASRAANEWTLGASLPLTAVRDHLEEAVRLAEREA